MDITISQDLPSAAISSVAAQGQGPPAREAAGAPAPAPSPAAHATGALLAPAVSDGASGRASRPAGQDTSRATEEAARLLGVRDTSGDRLDVKVDEKVGVIVRVVDAQGNVVRQIPPEELVNLARRLDEIIGVLFDKKV